LAVIHCPKCNATLPDFAVRCQFCGTTFASRNVDPRARAAGGTADAGQPRWVWPAYYAIGGWWVVTGAISVLRSVLPGGGAGSSGFLVIVGLVNIVFGVGLIARVEIIRGIANVLCFVNILFGLLGVVTGFLMTGILGGIGALMMIQSVIDIALAGLLIFLIGETDTGARNL
jgi:hypothetical protein